jgi:hypothetical protein
VFPVLLTLPRTHRVHSRRDVAAHTPPPPSVAPVGRLVLVEFRKESAWVPIREEHKMSVREARMELETEGYRFDRVIDVLPWQHILVFRR